MIYIAIKSLLLPNKNISKRNSASKILTKSSNRVDLLKARHFPSFSNIRG